MNPWVLIALEWSLGLSCYHQHIGKCADVVGSKKPFDMWWKMAGPRIKDKFSGFVDLRYAWAVERFYPDAFKAITKEERAAVENYISKV